MKARVGTCQQHFRFISSMKQEAIINRGAMSYYWVYCGKKMKPRRSTVVVGEEIPEPPTHQLQIQASCATAEMLSF